MILRRRDQSADLLGRIGMMTAEVLEQTEYGIRRDEGDGDVEGIAVRERIADFIMHGEVAWAVRNQRWLIDFGGVLPGFDQSGDDAFQHGMRGIGFEV